MQVIVESRHAEGEAIRSMAEDRLRFVLRRLAWRIPRARLSLLDTNGPRGGVDKKVQVELRLDGLQPVVVSATSADWRRSIDTAIDRAARTLLRTCRRARGATSMPRPEFQT